MEIKTFHSYCFDLLGQIGTLEESKDIVKRAAEIGAHDYENSRIEVGFSVVRGWQGRGLATEALIKVLDYLTKNEGISCMTAWCAAENAGSRRVLEKSGMRHVRTDPNGLTVGENRYDKMIYEYRREP